MEFAVRNGRPRAHGARYGFAMPNDLGSLNFYRTPLMLCVGVYTDVSRSTLVAVIIQVRYAFPRRAWERDVALRGNEMLLCVGTRCCSAWERDVALRGHNMVALRRNEGYELSIHCDNIFFFVAVFQIFYDDGIIFVIMQINIVMQFNASNVIDRNTHGLA